MENRVFTCHLCGKMYPRKERLKNHLTLVHLQQKEVCGICQKEYAGVSSLREHQRHVHHIEPGVKGRPSVAVTFGVREIGVQAVVATTNVGTDCSAESNDDSMWRGNPPEAALERMRQEASMDERGCGMDKENPFGDSFPYCSLCILYFNSINGLTKHNFVVHGASL